MGSQSLNCVFTVNTWAEHKRKQALHKIGLILYIWHKRGPSPYMEALLV